MMEDGSVKVKKKGKTGPLKSSPGFLKCMRSVYLYFKEEKEKGALNIPINSFIERTAVACGVGRKTLYNYAKKGLFDEHPTLLQPKKRKKKKGKPVAVLTHGVDEICRGHTLEVVTKKKARSVQVQTQTPVFLTSTAVNSNIANGATTAEDGYCELSAKDEKFSHGKGPSGEVSGPWAGGNAARRDIDYFTKTNIWQNVYSISTAEASACSAELTPSRMGNCQPTSSTLTDL